MEFRKLDTDGFSSWDAFCEKSGAAWFSHTTPFLRYQQAYRPALHTESEHFYLFRDGRVVAICPLAVETRTQDGQSQCVLSLGGDHLPAPVLADDLFAADRSRILRAMFEHIDRLAAERHAVRVSFRSAVLTPAFLAPTVAPVNECISFGYMDISLQTQILNLQLPLTQLWTDLRKSYHSPIRRAAENFQFELYDASDITQDIFDSYRLLHHRAAGRVTRPLETFQMMLDWIRQGTALLARVTRGSETVAAALIIVYKNKAYYGSSCEDPELGAQWALGHFMQWKLLEALKQRSVTHYELGWQPHAPQMSYIPTPDEQQIAFFKRGFGGFSVPLLCAEKFYSPEYFATEYHGRVERILERLRSPKIQVMPMTPSTDCGKRS